MWALVMGEDPDGEFVFDLDQWVAGSQIAVTLAWYADYRWEEYLLLDGVGYSIDREEERIYIVSAEEVLRKPFLPKDLVYATSGIRSFVDEQLPYDAYTNGNGTVFVFHQNGVLKGFATEFGDTSTIIEVFLFFTDITENESVFTLPDYEIVG
jgi:hypothetical protein